jgi:hypothetical protein
MLTFLFWNPKSKNAAVLANLVWGHAVDVLILAECPLLPAEVLRALNTSSADYYYTESQCSKLQLYTRFSEEYVAPLRENGANIVGDDYTFRLLALPNRMEVLLCAVHFPSKLRQERLDQTIYAVGFAKELERAEKAAGHTKTVLVGDLNMNPYDDGVVCTLGLHAVMTRAIAEKQTRTVKFESNLYFYNPMWYHFGEKAQGHAGTYYYGSPKTRADFWNIYDQVLVRSELLPYFRDEDVAILWRDIRSGTPLLKRDGRPDDETASDHLPVLFRLAI